MLLVLDKAVVHFVGRYERSRVLAIPTRRERRRDPRLERSIELAWARRSAEAPGGALFDADLVRLVAHGALPHRLALFLGRTTWREYVGTNLEAADLHESLGDDYFANPLGVRAAVLARDGALLLARRSPLAPEDVGTWDLPGREMPWRQDSAGDPFGTLLDDLATGMGIPASEIEDLACVALVEDGRSHKPDLVFACRVADRAKGLLRRLRGAAPRPAQDDVLVVPSTRNDLLDLLRARGDELTPVAAGGIAAFVS